MYLAIITLPLLRSIVSGFFGRKVGVSGAQIITCTRVIVTTILTFITTLFTLLVAIIGICLLSGAMAKCSQVAIIGICLLSGAMAKCSQVAFYISPVLDFLDRVAIRLEVPGKRPIYIPEEGIDADTLWDLLNGLSLSHFLLLFMFLYIMKNYLSEATVMDLTPVTLRDRDGLCYKGMIDFNSKRGFLLWFLYFGANGRNVYMVGKYVAYNNELYYGMFNHFPLDNDQHWYAVLPNTINPVEIRAIFGPMHRNRWILLKASYNVRIVSGFYSNWDIDPLSPWNFNSITIYGALVDVNNPYPYEVQ